MNPENNLSEICLFGLLLSLYWLWTIITRPPGRTFFTGEVGVVTWFVGLVGGDTVMLVEVAVVLLLTDAEGLLLSGGVKKKKSVRFV